MKKSQVLETYDEAYAREYNDTFLLDEWARNSVAYQLRLIRPLVRNAKNWLDVACGTGYFLSRFPSASRAGLDLSPEMLKVAQKRNPTARFFEGDFTQPRPEWQESWDLVSCMWWAYCMLESMSEIEGFIHNLAQWTTPGGHCYLPLCNPQKFDTENIKIPYVDPKVPGRIMITGIVWTWIQENGYRHDNVVSPQVEHMVGMFKRHFNSVKVHQGPLASIGEGWRVQDVLIASDKRSA